MKKRKQPSAARTTKNNAASLAQSSSKTSEPAPKKGTSGQAQPLSTKTPANAGKSSAVKSPAVKSSAEHSPALSETTLSSKTKDSDTKALGGSTPATNVQTLIPASANQVTLTPAPVASPASKNAKGRAKSSANPAVSQITPADNPQGLPIADSGIKETLAKKPAGSLQSPLRIFQYYQETWQRELLDPNFVALSGMKNNSEFQEFAIFEKLSKSEYIKGAQLWGALSWRFTETTGMAGADLIKYISSHPGSDVYFCNPYPHNEALFHNGWLQGETAHANFLAISQAVFQVTGLPVDELTSITASDHYASCNYLIATPKFWNVYLAWVANVISQANKKLPAKVRDLMHSAPPGDNGAHPGATYVTFIIERLFPVFMKTAGKTFQGHKIPLPERNRELNVHLKLLREMKDVAHKTKSAWLAACWINYRNLYCTQASGKAWCNKYLRTISPTEIKFS